MTPEQARALLELIADLYRLASAPPPAPVTAGNGTVPAEKPKVKA